MNPFMEPPGYWRYETSGVLAPVVMKYIHRQELNAEEIGIMRAYLRQWMARGDWRVEGDLLQRVDTIRTRADIDRWIHDALAFGIDPL